MYFREVYQTNRSNITWKGSVGKQSCTAPGQQNDEKWKKNERKTKYQLPPAKTRKNKRNESFRHKQSQDQTIKWTRKITENVKNYTRDFEACRRITATAWRNTFILILWLICEILGRSEAAQATTSCGSARKNDKECPLILFIPETIATRFASLCPFYSVVMDTG